MYVEYLLYVEIALSGLLIVGILHQGKIIHLLVDCIKFFLGDHEKKVRKLDDLVQQTGTQPPPRDGT